MKLKIFALCTLGLSALTAEQFEFGGAAGAGFPRGSSVTAPAGTASAGLANGPAFGVVLGHRLYPRIGGEVRYSFLKNDLRLAAGDSTTFGAQAHAVHYDLLVHAREADAPVQPFLAAGGGMMIFRGTGREAAYQPLSQYAYLTKTQEVKPLASVGGGVRVRIAPRVWLRTELRDYITPFPKKVITPARGAKLNGGWVHNIVPIAGISYIF